MISIENEQAAWIGAMLEQYSKEIDHGIKIIGEQIVQPGANVDTLSGALKLMQDRNELIHDLLKYINLKYEEATTKKTEPEPKAEIIKQGKDLKVVKKVKRGRTPVLNRPLIMSMHYQGSTNRAIAEALGTNYRVVGNIVNEEKSKFDIVDRDRINKLRKAGRSIKEIADDMLIPEWMVQRVIYED